MSKTYSNGSIKCSGDHAYLGKMPTAQDKVDAVASKKSGFLAEAGNETLDAERVAVHYLGSDWRASRSQDASGVVWAGCEFVIEVISV